MFCLRSERERQNRLTDYSCLHTQKPGGSDLFDLLLRVLSQISLNVTLADTHTDVAGSTMKSTYASVANHRDIGLVRNVHWQVKEIKQLGLVPIHRLHECGLWNSSA